MSGVSGYFEAKHLINDATVINGLKNPTTPETDKGTILANRMKEPFSADPRNTGTPEVKPWKALFSHGGKPTTSILGQSSDVLRAVQGGTHVGFDKLGNPLIETSQQFTTADASVQGGRPKPWVVTSVYGPDGKLTKESTLTVSINKNGEVGHYQHTKGLNRFRANGASGSTGGTPTSGSGSGSGVISSGSGGTGVGTSGSTQGMSLSRSPFGTRSMPPRSTILKPGDTSGRRQSFYGLGSMQSASRNSGSGGTSGRRQSLSGLGSIRQGSGSIMGIGSTSGRRQSVTSPGSTQSQRNARMSGRRNSMG